MVPEDVRMMGSDEQSALRGALDELNFVSAIFSLILYSPVFI